MRPGLLLAWKSLATATVATLGIATLPAPAVAATAAEFCSTTHPAAQPIVDQLNTGLRHRVGAMGRVHISLAVADPARGITCAVEEHRRTQSASIVKVAIVSALSLQSHLWGQTLTGGERALSRRAITQSDNDATVRLWEHLGRRFGLTRFLRSLGLSETVAGPSTHWGNTRVTAADQLTLLQDLLDPAGPIDAATQAFVLGLMADVRVDQRWGVVAGVPGGVPVALKNGWAPHKARGWRINSIGVVRPATGPYEIAVISDGHRGMAQGIRRVERTASIVNEALV